MTAWLSLHDLGHVYGDGSVGLDRCSLDIRRGTRNALLGANGSGKTTLLQHITGLLQPTHGPVQFDGRPLDYRRSGLSDLRRRVGLVFQNPDRQLISANVFEDVSFGPLNLGLDDATVRERVSSALAAVGMSEYGERPVHQLSFGQKKRVCIAGVLAMQPELLLLDEPMAGLDAGMQADLLNLLDQLVAQGMTVLLTTHDVDFAYRWADDLHLLAEGRCLGSFAADQLPEHAALLAAAGQPLPAVIRLHQQLAARGQLASDVRPRSLDILLAQLAPTGGVAGDNRRC